MPKRIAAMAGVIAGLGLAGAGTARAGESFSTKVVSGLCVDVAGGRLAEGTPIQLWGCHGKAPQRFGIEPTLGQIYVMEKQELCVDGRDKQTFRLVNCGQVHTQWRYDARGNTIRSANGLCWDVPNGHKDKNQYRPQVQLIAWKCWGGINQQFVYSGAAPAAGASKETVFRKLGPWTIVSNIGGAQKLPLHVGALGDMV